MTPFDVCRGAGHMVHRTLIGVVASGAMVAFVWVVASSNSTAGWAVISFAVTAAGIVGGLYLWTRPIVRLRAAQSIAGEKVVAIARPSLDFAAGLRRLGVSEPHEGRPSGGFVLLVVSPGILDVVGANGKLLARFTSSSPLTFAVAKPTELEGTTYGTLGLRVLVGRVETLVPLDFAISNPKWPAVVLKDMRGLEQLAVTMNDHFADGGEGGHAQS